MGDNNKSIFGSILGKSSDPDLNIPVTGGAGGLINPYLNLDPRLLQQDQDQYILPEGSGHQRGRFEMAFAQIGGSILAGGVFGGANGIYRSRIETKDLIGKARQTQMINIISKHGASSAQTFGVIGLWYSIFGVATSLIRGSDDSLNTLVAGAGTGTVYSISGGPIKMLRGAGIGFTLAAIYCLFTNPELRHFMDRGK